MRFYHRMPLKIAQKNDELFVDVISIDLDGKFKEEWIEFMKEKSHRVFFDVGTWEGKIVNFDWWKSIIIHCKPSLFVIPDVFDNPTDTYKIFKKLEKDVEMFHNFGCTPILVVSRYKLLDGSVYDFPIPPYVRIGVPYIPNVDRFTTFQYLKFRYPNHSFHLLGIQYPSEILLYKDEPNVLSIDSGIAFTTTKKGYSFGEGQYYKEVILDVDTFDGSICLLKDNIIWLNELAGGECNVTLE